MMLTKYFKVCSYLAKLKHCRLSMVTLTLMQRMCTDPFLCIYVLLPFEFSLIKANTNLTN